MQSKVKEINDLLRSFGDKAIQQSNIPGRGQVTGYKPQYVLDSINAVIGQNEWRWEIINEQIYLPNEQGKGGNVYVRIALYVKMDEEWLRKGEHYGGAKISTSSVGDALKAATTDALQKAFSTMSVARDSYSGLLKQNSGRQAWERNKSESQEGSKPRTEIKPDTSPAPNLQAVPGKNQQEPDGFEALLDRSNAVKKDRESNEEDGVISPADYGLQVVKNVKFIKNGDFINAKDVKSGASYFARSILAEMGFSFQKESRCWGKAI